MKKVELLILLPLLIGGCSSNSNNSSSFNSSSSTKIEESTSSVLDYGTVNFDDIEIYSEGFDGVILRPYFSNHALDGKIEFEYTVDDESVCYIEDNKVYYLNAGSTKITAYNEIYGEKTFYVKATKEMTPSWLFPIAKQMNQSVMNNYEDGDTLFVGDSFFQFWRDGEGGLRKFSDTFADYKVFNIGISGSTTHDWRASHDKTVSLTNPKNIVINIGVNNVDDDGEPGIICFRNVKALVDDYLEMFEETNIYYLSITKCTGVFASKWPDHLYSNMMMEKYCESKDRLHYLDVMELYGDTPAVYQSDGLHPNQAGYDLFEQIIKENVPLEEK